MERLHFHALEKAMATHSSVLAWRIPGAVEPGGLLFMGSHRVGHDRSDLAAARNSAETPVLWPPDAKSWLIWKDPDAGKDWGQEEKGTTEDEMVGWHHRLDEHGFEWVPGVGDWQGGLVCCDSWGRKESDTTERLNWRNSGTGTETVTFFYTFYYLSNRNIYLLLSHTLTQK